MMHRIAMVLGLLVMIGTNYQLLEATNEEENVKNIVQAFEKYWNQHDMEGFATLFAEDADFVNVRGTRWLGRSAIKDAHAQNHRNHFKTSRLTVNETSVRFLKPDIAVTRSVWELVGYTTPTGEVGEPRKGIVTHVIVKQNDKWEIVVTQNTDILPSK